MRRLPPASAAVLVLSIIVAFAYRVVPSYHAVMTNLGVNFQDNDSWYHMRVVHNIAAHFPHQSGFDPYASLPGRQNAYSDPWDTTIAALAWLLGLGKPSEELIDQVGAFLPAFLGALLPLPLFVLARRLAGDIPARWTAVAAAVLPGILIWATHLGVPDHHVAECLLSVAALVLLCGAIENTGRAQMWRIAVSGLLFGIHLCVRPAAIFVPATLTLAALLEPALVPLVAAVLVVASAVFLTSTGSVWASFTWLTLAGCMIALSLVAVLNSFWRRKHWSRAFLLPAVVVTAALAIGIVAAARPEVFAAMVERIRRYLPGSSSQTHSIAELLPLWTVPPGGVPTLFETLGGVWLPALPVLLYGLYAACRSRRPVIVLCAVWGLVMTIAGVLQMRMWVYGEPALAVAAGIGCAWIMARLPFLQTPIAIATAALLAAISIPHGIDMIRTDRGPSPDWHRALGWLRSNTPEPLGDPKAWLGLWPALKPGQDFAYPPSAYGVLTWWDYGDWINAIGHRIPSTNGTQANADEVAAFLTSTSPEKAEAVRAGLNARYAILNSDVTLKFWNIIVQWSKQNSVQFQRSVSAPGPDGVMPVTIYLPGYYRSMAVRMYNFDGQAIPAAREVSVFTTKHERSGSGPERDNLIAEKRFATEEQALRYMQVKSIQLNPGESMTFGSLDPLTSCVNVEALAGVKRVFTSSASFGPQTVKIFELQPQLRR